MQRFKNILLVSSPQATNEATLDRAVTLAKKPQVHLVKGEAKSVIPELASEKEVDLIVMGTVCRTGVAGFLIGNTAEGALQQVDCSVLAVKPDEFVSPVRSEEG